MDAIAMFRAIDKNDAKKLARGELKRFLESQEWAAGVMSSPDFNWRTLWNEFDKDGDGVWNQNEFVKFYFARLLIFIQKAGQAMFKGIQRRLGPSSRGPSCRSSSSGSRGPSLCSKWTSTSGRTSGPSTVAASSILRRTLSCPSL